MGEHDDAGATRPDPVSRRDTLRGIGAAAAITWAAPAVTSVASASAQGASGACNQANSFVICGDVITPCGVDCHCNGTAEGNFVCRQTQAIPCNEMNCVTSADCPTGWVCLDAQNCCGVGVCRALCGVVVQGGAGADPTVG